MRVVKCAGLAVAALLLASIASAQGIGDAAAREKEKRKAGSTSKPARVYTESDLGSASSAMPAPVVESADAAKPGEAKPGEAKPGAADPEKAAAEAAAKAQEEWRQKLDKARQDEAAHQATIDRLQAILNDTSSMYSPGWTQAMAKMDETKQQLAQVRAQVASLEAEGRRAGYR